MSERWGTAFNVEVPGARMEAAIIGSEAFFEPFTLTVPFRVTGP